MGRALGHPESSRHSLPGLWIDRRTSDPTLPCAEHATGSSWRERMSACFAGEGGLVNPMHALVMEKIRRGSQISAKTLPHQMLWGSGPGHPGAAGIGNMNGMRLDGPWRTRRRVDCRLDAAHHPGRTDRRRPRPCCVRITTGPFVHASVARRDASADVHLTAQLAASYLEPSPESAQTFFVMRCSSRLRLGDHCSKLSNLHWCDVVVHQQPPDGLSKRLNLTGHSCLHQTGTLGRSSIGPSCDRLLPSQLGRSIWLGITMEALQALVVAPIRQDLLCYRIPDFCDLQSAIR
jgi:hypothetical protein